MNTYKAGIHPNLSFKTANFSPLEESIIKSFSKFWFITFIKKVNFKDSSYAYAFARPTDKLFENFRLDREVLILLTRYKNFEPRDLDFVDKTIFEFQNRLDKLCFIIVSPDNRVRDKVQSLTLQEPETRVIIPYTYKEIYESKNPNIIFGRLKEFFYGRDLFSFESPLYNDNYFFGRQAIVNFFYDKYKSGENSGLFGLRRIGKTSVLFALKRYLNKRGEFATFIDCQEPSFYLRNWFEALEFISKEIARNLEMEMNINVEITSPYTEKDASIQFQQDLERFHEKLSGKRILIIFDEIENITYGISPNEIWSSNNNFILFWQALRSIFQKNPKFFSFMIAGVNPKIIETSRIGEFDNPIYRMITPRYLNFFNVTNTKDMISTIGKYMGLDFDEEIYTFLVEDYGGHPFLIRQVCSQIHNNLQMDRPCKVEKYYYKKMKPDFDKSLRDYVELTLEVLRTRYKTEYDLLELLAIDENDKFNATAQISPLLIQHLEGYNLITHSDGKYFITINAVKELLKENSDIIKSMPKIEDKWEEITSKRNSLETKLRSAVKFILKANYSHNQAKEEFLKIIDENRRVRFQNKNLDEIFKGESEIYFKDLTTYISKNWNKFEKIFSDKPIFESHMTFINNHRVDAHARNISDEEYAILIMSLKWVDTKVSQFLK